MRISSVHQISLRDPENKSKYIGSDENWEKAERAIIEATEEVGLATTTELGEAAFYGPKLDFMVKDALGRSWQLGTIQVDYNLPERFELEYIGSDNQKHRPVMIHRAPFGSMERFIGVLTEHCAGKFPLWLTPEQFAILPLSDKYLDYAHEVNRQLHSELKKIPYMLIVGEKEAAEGNISVRRQGSGDQGAESIEDFIKDLEEQIG